MNNFNNVIDIMNHNKELDNVIVFQGNIYTMIRKNENVERGEHNNLTCITYRNRENNHNIDVYYLEDVIEYVETGYSLS